MKDDAERLRHSTYAPEGLKEYLAYKADVDRRVGEGHLTAKEGVILCMVRMEGIRLEGGSGSKIRSPECQACGAPVPIIGAVAERFRCPCSPEIEQSIADGVRKWRTRSKQTE